MDGVFGHSSLMRGCVWDSRPEPRSGLDLFGHLWPVVLPDIPRPVGVFQELLRRAPVVPDGDKGRTLIQIEVIPVVRIGHVRTHTDVVNVITSNHGASLARKCINSCSIAQPGGD